VARHLGFDHLGITRGVTEKIVDADGVLPVKRE